MYRLSFYIEDIDIMIFHTASYMQEILMKHLLSSAQQFSAAALVRQSASSVWLKTKVGTNFGFVPDWLWPLIIGNTHCLSVSSYRLQIPCILGNSFKNQALSSIPHDASPCLLLWHDFTWPEDQPININNESHSMEKRGSIFKIKMFFFRYGESYYKDKTVMRLSNIYHGNHYTGKIVSSYWHDPYVAGVPNSATENKHEIIFNKILMDSARKMLLHC